MDYLVVIPARYKSSRLPGKPLLKIRGIPMIIQTFKRCQKVFPKEKIIVATDNKRIISKCREFKIKSMLTSKKCLTGTDRVAEIAKKIKKSFYINVQGDEPFINLKDLKTFLKYAKKNPKKIINGYAKINSKKEYLSVSIPKLIVNKKNKLLYMSRAPIPTTKNKKFVKSWTQICIYSFPRKALLEFSSLSKKTEIEKIEDIEILRFLEIGHQVDMVKLKGKSFSIDTKEDLKRANNL